MALAGAERIFAMMDERSEEDEGKVTLVNAGYINGALTEVPSTPERGRGRSPRASWLR